MHSRTFAATAAVATALICAAGWVHEHQALRQVTQTQVFDTLDQIAEMLKENAAVTHELTAAPYAEGDDDFVSAYLIKIRRDGVPKYSHMKQRIDRLNNNNTAILALLARYSTHMKSAAFKASAERFRDYTISLRDRWQSMFEIFMAGGNLPTAGPAFPAEFSDAMAAESAAAR